MKSRSILTNKKYFFSEKVRSKNKLIEIIKLNQNEFKDKKLLSAADPTTDEVLNTGYLDYLIKICTFIPSSIRSKKLRILDIGCGESRLLLLLQAIGYTVYGVDAFVFDGFNIEGVPREPLLKEYFKLKKVKIHKLNVLNEKLPFNDEYFDLIFCTEVVEHFHNSPKSCFIEMKRVIKKAGFIVLTTPNYARFENRVKSILGKSNHQKLERYYNYKISIPPSIDFVGHVREYTLQEIKKIFKWESFNIVVAKTFNFPQKRVVMKLINIFRNMGINSKHNIVVVAQK